MTFNSQLLLQNIPFQIYVGALGKTLIIMFFFFRDKELIDAKFIEPIQVVLS